MTSGFSSARRVEEREANKMQVKQGAHKKTNDRESRHLYQEASKLLKNFNVTKLDLEFFQLTFVSCSPLFSREL